MSFLEIKHLCKSYKQNQVLNDINIEFPSNGLFGILGESGSGKSTLLKCLSGVLKFEKGDIFFQSKKVNDINVFRNENISFIFQDFELVNYLSVLENVALPLLCKGINEKEAYRKAKECLLKTNIAHKEKELVQVLSGGEKQRVAIARSLCEERSIILCDEITGSLDEMNALEIMNIIKEISKTHLVIMVSHDEELMDKYADYNLSLINKTINYSIGEKEEKNIKTKKKEKRKPHILHLTINNLKKERFRTVSSLISFTITFLFLLFTISFSSNADAYLNEHRTDFLDYDLIKVSEIERKELENSSLTLLKQKVPSSYELNKKLGENNIKIHPCLENVFSTYPTFICNGEKIENIAFYPLTSNVIKKYNLPINSLHDVVINDKAIVYLRKGDYLSYSLKKDVAYQEEKVILDQLSFSYTFNVKSIFNEFSFFNTPKIYYSLEYAEEYLKNIKVDNLSSYYSKDISWYDRLFSYSFLEDEFHSFSRIVEFNDFSLVSEMSDKLEKEGYEVNSSSRIIINEFQSIYSLIEMAMEIFMMICLVISLMLFALIIFSFVISSYKEIGLYKVFGLDNHSIQKMFILKGLLLILISFILGEFFKIVILKIIQFILFDNNIEIYPIYISSNDILLVIVLGLISICLSLIPSYLVKKIEIETMFKEE